MKTIINGKEYSIEENKLQTSLLDFLREDLNLTGTKNGCGIGVCGACTILVDNMPMRSCIKKVADIVGKSVITIEGMEQADGTVAPIQQAFIDCGAIQCGFCTPGMVLTAHSLLLHNNQPSEDEIKKALKGNLCRCTGYKQIIDAVKTAAKKYRE
ncbi:MAG: (2Fe-2S)-binding protein [Candidatus Zophobacter franzmannii]|jgi:carbon-monoxide dehydrogenase small subunit|nr:(2Fe-2S)-binding protein [Candidatus Zophobacter franzmannii]